MKMFIKEDKNVALHFIINVLFMKSPGNKRLLIFWFQLLLYEQKII